MAQTAPEAKTLAASGGFADIDPNMPPLISGKQWYSLFVMPLFYLVNTFDRTIMAVMIEPIEHEFEMSDKMLGLLVGLAFAVSYRVASIPLVCCSIM